MSAEPDAVRLYFPTARRVSPQVAARPAPRTPLAFPSDEALFSRVTLENRSPG